MHVTSREHAVSWGGRFAGNKESNGLMDSMGSSWSPAKKVPSFSGPLHMAVQGAPGTACTTTHRNQATL